MTPIFLCLLSANENLSFQLTQKKIRVIYKIVTLNEKMNREDRKWDNIHRIKYNHRFSGTHPRNSITWKIARFFYYLFVFIEYKNY